MQGNNQVRQQGSVLPISLLILLILTVVGITSMQAATIEERMTGGLQDQNRSFQSAEAALIEVENQLLEEVENQGACREVKISNGITNVPLREICLSDFDSTVLGLFAQNTLQSQYGVEQPFGRTEGKNYAADADAASNVAAVESSLVDFDGNPINAQYTVEFIGNLPRGGTDGSEGSLRGEVNNRPNPLLIGFRVTARNRGVNAGTEVILQTQVGRCVPNAATGCN